MTEVRFLPPAAKFLKKLKDKKLRLFTRKPSIRYAKTIQSVNSKQET